MLYFPNVGHVIIIWTTVSFKFRIIHVHMYNVRLIYRKSSIKPPPYNTPPPPFKGRKLISPPLY